MSANVWVIGAGKGGVGKTFITSSLGISLTKLNYSVLLIDFDLSGATLHTCFDIKLSEKNLRHYFDGSQKIIDLIQPTQVPKLSIVQGFWDDWSLSEVNVEQVKKFVDSCRATDFDFVLVDLGAGSGSSNMELLKLADEKILVVDPEPTAIEKNYRYLESYVCHTLKERASSDAFLKIQNALREYRKTDGKGLFSFRDYLHQATGFSFDYFESLTSSPLRLIVNSSRSRQDQDLGHGIKSVSKKYFDLQLDYVGSIDYDNAVWQSIRDHEPVLITKPFTPLAGQFLTLTRHILNHRSTYHFSTKQIKAVV
jgi:flagellar biosynthesis protein FlhG